MTGLDAATLRKLGAIVGERSLLTAPEDLRVYECDGLTAFRALPRAVMRRMLIQPGPRQRGPGVPSPDP